jgi:hypothetical protein
MTIERTNRFEKKFIPELNSGCWIWTGGRVPDGYGSFYWGQDGIHSLKAHRAAWTIYCGPIPADKQVLHTCDNRACVNPDHLYLGDNDMNVADRVRRGRSSQLFGVTNPRAKLNERAAEAILLDPRTYEEIAADYGITPGSVRQIKAGRIWKQVTNGRSDRRGVPRGSKVGGSKLTESHVRAIRRDNRAQWKIAADYSVCRMTISFIKQRKTWCHVD